MSELVIHVIDDDAAVRDSLRFMLEAADFRVRVYDRAAAVLERVAELEQGCIITDVRMPEMSGLELVGKLKEHGDVHPVIVLTGHADVALAVEAMKAGVVDFIEKPFDEKVLLRAVRAALERGRGDSKRAAERAEIGARIARLTPRELDVFEAIVGGESNKAAAIKLGISPRTIEIYRANVMEKMQAATLSDLVRMAMLRDAL